MSVAEHIVRTVALLIFLALVLILGWNEPLKYRFMSRAEIYALENPQQVPVADNSWMWDKGRKGKLDREAYGGSSGRSSSSSIFGGR